MTKEEIDATLEYYRLQTDIMAMQAELELQICQLKTEAMLLGVYASTQFTVDTAHKAFSGLTSKPNTNTQNYS